MDTEQVQKLLEKWEPVLNSPKAATLRESHRAPLAILLENQSRYLAEQTLSGDIARFQPVIIPVIRRVFPNLIANELVAVQAMSSPSGLAFAMRYRYTGSGRASAEPTAQVILTLADATNFTEYDGSTGGDIAGQGSGTGKVLYKEGNNILVKVLTGAFTASQNVDNAAAYSAGETTVSAVYTNEAGFNFILKNYTGSYTTAQAEKLGTDMREVGLGISSTAITAKSRALKAQYSVEMAQDLKAVHNLDIESELATILSYEIQQEIDRELIDVLDTQAALNSSIAYDYATADGRWEQEKYRNLYVRIVKAANQIGKATRRGPGNFLICGADTATAIEAMDTFTASPVKSDVDSTSLGVAVIGTLGGRFKVVKDTFRDSNDIVVGYKGAALADTGVVYSPYVPLTMMTAQGQDDFQPRIGFKTRYAVTTDFGTESSKDYYRKVTVANLPG